MKKIFTVLLLIFIIGCAKKQLPPPQGMTTPKEPVVKETMKPSVEDVKESVQQKEAQLKEGVLETKAGEHPVLKDIHFDYDQYNIREDARPVLSSIAAYLKKNESVSIIVEGHCDERGTNEYNLALGENRAKSAMQYLTTLGIKSSRMSTVTYGEEKPVCTDQNETCWQKNRRAHFVEKGK